MPHHVPSATAYNRFNDASGSFALRYFAATPAVALAEAGALYGSPVSGFVAAPPPATSWTVFRYSIQGSVSIVDFTDPAERAATTTIQELTGDWLGYRLRLIAPAATVPAVLPGTNVTAPTQQLAHRIRAIRAHGFMVPSAKAPTIPNLVLFVPGLPDRSVAHTGTAIVVL